MKIDKNFKIEKACSVDKLRVVLHHVHIEDGKAVATDGRMMAVVPCEHEKNESGINIHKETLVKVQKGCGKYMIPDIKVSKGANVTEFTAPDNTIYKDTNVDFPNWKCVLPDSSRPVKRIGLDAELLLRLSEALGNDKKSGHKVIIEIGLDCEGKLNPTDAFKILPSSTKSEAYGILMPVRVE